jgi:hypothetical protein
MKNLSLSAMSTESLKVLLQSSKPELRALAASILSARMVEVKVEGFGEREGLPKMGANPASRVTPLDSPSE